MKSDDVNELRERVEILEQRVSQLESVIEDSSSSSESSSSSWRDARDAAVLDALDDNGIERVPLGLLRKLYRTRTDVRNPDTMRKRIKNLTEYGPFEYQGNSSWVYHEGAEDE